MNKDSITSKLRNKAKLLGLNYNLVLSKFFFDEFLKILSKSKYQENFMLKGGMLLTYTLGVQNRSTQDIDFLVKGVRLDSLEIKNILDSVLQDEFRTGVWFETVGDCDEIRLEDEYGGLRFHIVGHLSNMRIKFAIDIATGDPIYPFPKLDDYTTVIGEKIKLMLYPLESVISEKLQTVLTRAENNSRSKDFYDIYIILKTKTNKINFDSLKVAVSLTFKYRNTILTREDSLNIANRICNNKYIKDRWIRYRSNNPYAKDIEFESIMDEIIKLIEMVM